MISNLCVALYDYSIVLLAKGIKACSIKDDNIYDELMDCSINKIK